MLVLVLMLIAQFTQMEHLFEFEAQRIVDCPLWDDGHSVAIAISLQHIWFHFVCIKFDTYECIAHRRDPSTIRFELSSTFTNWICVCHQQCDNDNCHQYNYSCMNCWVKRMWHMNENEWMDINQRLYSNIRRLRHQTRFGVLGILRCIHHICPQRVPSHLNNAAALFMRTTTSDIGDCKSFISMRLIGVMSLQANQNHFSEGKKKTYTTHNTQHKHIE